MADNNNDVINDILNQLDNEKKNEAEVKPVQEKTEEKVVKPAAEAVRREAPAVRPVQKNTERPQQNEGARQSASAASEQPRAPRPRPRMDEAAPVRNSDAVKRNAAHHKKKKKKKNRSRLPGVLILTVSIFAVSICLSLVIIAFGKDMFGIGKDDTTKMIFVKENTNTEQMSQQLYEEGIINSPKCFQLFSKFRKTPDVSACCRRNSLWRRCRRSPDQAERKGASSDA